VHGPEASACKERQKDFGAVLELDQDAVALLDSPCGKSARKTRGLVGKTRVGPDLGGSVERTPDQERMRSAAAGMYAEQRGQVQAGERG